MSETSTLIGYGGRTIGREELNAGADTGGNGNASPDPASRDRASPHRDAGLSPHRSGSRRIRGIAGRHEGLWRPRSRNRNGRMPLLHRAAQLPRQEHAPGDDLRLSRVCVLEHGIRGGLYSRTRQTLEVVFADRLHLGWR